MSKMRYQNLQKKVDCHSYLYLSDPKSLSLHTLSSLEISYRTTLNMFLQIFQQSLDHKQTEKEREMLTVWSIQAAKPHKPQSTEILVLTWNLWSATCHGWWSPQRDVWSSCSPRYSKVADGQTEPTSLFRIIYFSYNMHLFFLCSLKSPILSFSLYAHHRGARQKSLCAMGSQES